MPIQSQNPATGEVVQTFEELSDDAVKNKIAIAQTTFETWRDVPLSEKKAKMKKLAEHLRAEARTYGELATIEMGKPITQAIAEVEKSALLCDWYADNTEEILKPEMVETDAQKSYVSFEPLGIVLAVMPWNYPYWQALRFIVPAAMAGNVGLLKHASNVPQCAAALETMFAKAGFPEGVFQNLHIGSKKVEPIIRDPRVKAVTLTGSEWAGRKVAEAAGDEIKPVVLELGGSDPFIVLDDAEIEIACEVGAMARLQNNGQSCIAAKRFIVVESRVDEFIEKYVKTYQSLVVGDPMNEATQVGPMVNESGLKEIEEQVNESVKKGATILTGGKQKDEQGYYFEPTILGNVQKGMPAYDQEMFGPVAAIISVKDEEEAIRVANDSPFGLGASLWTKDLEKAEKLARRIESGAVFINSMTKSDPRLPFGGIKKSGIGRELSHYGMKEFLNAKTVYIK